MRRRLTASARGRYLRRMAGGEGGGAAAEILVRDCVLCGADDAAPLFTYTFRYLTEVLGMAPAAARAKGWSEATSSTIVRCRRCACIYVRDAVLESLPEPPEEDAARGADVERRVAAARAHDTFKFYRTNDEEAWIVRNLVFLAADRQQRDIRFLDFGAGRANACTVARALGVRDVFAYDPFYVSYIQDVLDRANAPGIVALRTRRELLESAPFDAVVFQSSIEHVADPRGELATIYEAMAPGGYLYVNNPFMDLARELDELRQARRIAKKDRISHYHPWHLNYLTPAQFRRLLEECGFRVTPLALYPPVPAVARLWRKILWRNAKAAIRLAQNAMRLPYDRYVFVAEKPPRA